jgi:hypothetical protein
VIVISDTSPITNLAAVGHLSLLKQLYGDIIIPERVYQELTGAGDSIPSGSIFQMYGITLLRKNVPLLPQLPQLPQLPPLPSPQHLFSNP